MNPAYTLTAPEPLHHWQIELQDAYRWLSFRIDNLRAYYQYEDQRMANLLQRMEPWRPL